METCVQIGCCGAKIEVVQAYLNILHEEFPTIPVVKVDGIYGPVTSMAVRIFQKQFKLTPTGCVDCPTWFTLMGAVKEKHKF